jgi:hypothetical protein
MRNPMIRLLSLAACATFATAAAFGAMAQHQSAARYVSPGEADQQLANSQAAATTARNEIKAVLLQPAGWIANWARAGDVGQSDIVFEARGDSVVAKIRNLTYVGHNCEKNVTITSDNVKFDACLDYAITLRFDAKDKKYPFKGTSASGYDYKLQPKDEG